MENGSGNGHTRKISRQSLGPLTMTVRLEGHDVIPARVEGNYDVFRAPKFVLAKARWVSDADVSTCVSCASKFNQLRRKHHCRVCGLVFCSKCCKEKVSLPQLACEEPERVCEMCRPVAQLVAKSRSSHLPNQLESAKGLAQAARDPALLPKVVELGGLQALITLSLIDSVHMRRHLTLGLHALSTHQQLHAVMAEAGAIKAVCRVLTSVGGTEDDTLCDGISALMVFCKAPELKMKAVEDGALGPVVEVMHHASPAPALLALMTLAHIATLPDTHRAIVDSPRQALTKVLALTVADDQQMQEIALKILAHLSNGSDGVRHRIVQDDFSSGRCVQRVLARADVSTPRSQQILCNATCLIANLTLSASDQGGLQETMDLCCTLMASNPSNSELLCHLARALANFAAFKQNADRLMNHVGSVVSTCLRSTILPVKHHAMRFLLSLLSHLPDRAAQALTRDGAEELLQGLGSLPGLLDVIRATLVAQAADRASPS